MQEITRGPVRFKLRADLQAKEDAMTEGERAALNACIKELGEGMASRFYVRCLDAMGIPRGKARYPWGAW